MKPGLKDEFISKWNRHFGDSELPLAVFYSDDYEVELEDGETRSHSCVIEELSEARRGETLALNAGNIGCRGGKRYLGFSQDIGGEDFEHFLSYGIPGKVDGERYKKSPELVRKSMGFAPPLVAPKSAIVFKRWDKLSSRDDPEVVVFFATADVLSGLFTLANFDEAEPDGVICPFGSGCSSIVYHPYAEHGSSRPRCVIGMFDISARPYVDEGVLTFAAPMSKFERMVDNMDESFLITDSWSVLRKTRDKSL
ncbi:MAG: DUF169 domain-containing protein [Methanobacteriota archaeon]|nr:MAG: DUF169 domain-containing protein [Euryarchaeota archaeon]